MMTQSQQKRTVELLGRWVCEAHEVCLASYLQRHARRKLRGFFLEVRGFLGRVDCWRADEVDHWGAILALLRQLRDIAYLHHRRQWRG